MNPAPGTPSNKGPIVIKTIAWVSWTFFLLCSVGACFFAIAAKSDVYFIRHYEHFPMDTLTVLMTTHPVWMVVLPFVWLPWVFAFQRKDNPIIGTVVLQVITEFIVVLALVVLLLCSGPPIQM